jgi:PAS domain S-box-containing protein
MQLVPVPSNESARLARLHQFGVLDSLPQRAFDDITALASSLCGTPYALISLVDEHRQWFKSKLGIEMSETPREVAFCAHAINQPDRVMVVEDASQDSRFSGNPLVLRSPQLRFYAGAPIVTDDGLAMGTVCVLDSQARALTEAQGTALQTLANLVVSLLEHEKERAELQALRTSQANHRSQMMAALAASGLDLIAYLDADCVYRYVNHRYLTYWGKAASEIIGRKVVDLVGTSIFESTVKPNFERAMAGEEVAFESQVNFTALGKRFVEVVYVPAQNEDGSRGVVVRTHDIDAIKQRKAQLREAVALLEHKTLEQERFIHIISHDLREPINTINNFSALLADDEALGLPDHARRYLGFVRDGGQRMALLLDDLLNFVRLEKHAIRLEPVNLAVIASQVQSDLNAYLVRSGGSIDVQALPEVIGDPSLLRIVLQNLVSNALKFGVKETPRLVRLSARTEGDFVLLSVADNGIGIPADKLTSIFEMFKRLHSLKEFEGTGLGLSICRRIAELHGGQVSVTSVLGQGSCFTLHLPIRTANNAKEVNDECL